ncbi:MAG: T9SS type A sorting domain-containing protein, partial [Elusimicrobiota bacterium]|nr:T9SS type A sorting domain-containing protein [Elusimicrobiota bacterium]
IVYEIKFENNTTKLNGLAKITLPYTDLEISGMDEENLRMYTREGNIWKMLNTSVTMLDENKVQAETNHFSIFRIMEYVPSGVLMDKASVYTYPNPAKGNTLTFKFYVADKSYVTVDVYSVAGQKVKRLEKANCPAGIVSEIVWDMGNVASGVYIYKVEAKSASGSEKVIKKLAIIH